MCPISYSPWRAGAMFITGRPCWRRTAAGCPRNRPRLWREAEDLPRRRGRRLAGHLKPATPGEHLCGGAMAASPFPLLGRDKQPCPSLADSRETSPPMRLLFSHASQWPSDMDMPISDSGGQGSKHGWASLACFVRHGRPQPGRRAGLRQEVGGAGGLWGEKPDSLPAQPSQTGLFYAQLETDMP